MLLGRFSFTFFKNGYYLYLGAMTTERKTSFGAISKYFHKNVLDDPISNSFKPYCVVDSMADMQNVRQI